MTDLASYRSLFDLGGRKAVVIGAGSGIGRAGAFGLAAHGAQVVCADLDEGAAAATARAIRKEGGQAEYAAVDLARPDSVDALFAAHPDLRVMVTTPAINVRKRLLDISPEEFESVVGLNLRGAFFAIRAAGARMADGRGGSIIAVSSIRAQVVEPGQGVYAATKAGVVQMIKTLAAELGPVGVRANALAPGVVETPLTDQIKADAGWYQAYAAKGALGRWARPIEMAGPIVFLASDASSFVTGSQLVADGGWLSVDGRFTPPL